MTDGLELRIAGAADAAATLRALPAKLRRRVLLNSLKAGGRAVRDVARRNTPILRDVFKAPHRKAGVLRKAISVRTSKNARRAGDVGVFVNVKPAGKLRVVTSKRGRQSVLGRGSTSDPYYWQWVNYDHRSRAGNLIPGRRFLEAGAGELPRALRIIEAHLGPQIQRLDRNPNIPL